MDEKETVFTWEGQPDAPWMGPDFWGNRTQDWELRGGRVQTIERAMARGMRTAFLMTRHLDPAREPFTVSVRSGVVDGDVGEGAYAGLLVGVGKGQMHPLAAATVQWDGNGAGLFAGVGPSGHALIHDYEKPLSEATGEGTRLRLPPDFRLTLTGTPQGEAYDLRLVVSHADSGEVLSTAEARFPAERLTGLVAMGVSPGVDDTRFWFDDLRLTGPKFKAAPGYAFGPVVNFQYTIDRRILKLTAQLAPVGESTKSVSLDIKRGDRWETIATTEVIRPGYTAPFRVEGWDDTADHEVRVVYEGATYTGVVRKNPSDADTLVLGMVNCMHQNSHSLSGAKWGGGESPPQDWVLGMWFPHRDLVDKIERQNPDLMFYAGDQIYEGNSPTKADTANYELDYLFKWYLFTRTMEPLLRTRPSVTIPDDHDIYQGNLWGAGGRKTDKDDKGGYVHPAWFVKMVERTQTSHLPDPVDPRPVQQGIGVYFTEMVYGGVGFAIIEDRKFKSGPVNPDTGKRFDAHDPTLQLLGERQLDFLAAWAGDWEGQHLKAVLSQTVFAQANTHSGSKLGRMKADVDTNGFPVPGRNRAVDAIRRAFAVHLCGDQHLATLLRHGIDDFGDGMYSFCGPSAANFWPRAWNPAATEAYRVPGSAEDYLGDYVDGWGNKITMYAAANPGGPPTGLVPTDLYDRVTGYGIVRFDKRRQKITFECWPRQADPADSSQQYPGWPKTIDLADNYGRQPSAYLPTLKINGLENPVVRITDAQSGELIYARRFTGDTFTPGVFAPGSYDIEVGEPATQHWRKIESVKSQATPRAWEIPLDFK